jgi:hypothetical protein
MAPIVAAESGVPYPLITALTTGTSAPIAIPASFRHHNFMVTAATGVTAGAVTIETSNDPSDSLTWAIVIMDKSVANPLTVTGGANLLMAYSGLLNFVRARINTTISGGGAPSVTVTYEGAKSY